MCPIVMPAKLFHATVWQPRNRRRLSVQAAGQQTNMSRLHFAGQSICRVYLRHGYTDLHTYTWRVDLCGHPITIYYLLFRWLLAFGRENGGRQQPNTESSLYLFPPGKVMEGKTTRNLPEYMEGVGWRGCVVKPVIRGRDRYLPTSLPS